MFHKMQVCDIFLCLYSEQNLFLNDIHRFLALPLPHRFPHGDGYEHDYPSRRFGPDVGSTQTLPEMWRLDAGNASFSRGRNESRGAETTTNPVSSSSVAAGVVCSSSVPPPTTYHQYLCFSFHNTLLSVCTITRPYHVCYL